MKNYIQSWRASILSESNPLLLNEGLFDLGLPAIIPETINLNFEGVPEKGKTMIGNLYKNQVFNQLTRGYAMPLMNDVAHLNDQIFDSTLDLFKGDKALEKLSSEDKEKLTQFLKNVRNTFVSVQFVNPDKRANYSEWRTKVGDIQKAIKMVKKGYSRGIINKLIGDTTETKAYPEMFETLAEDIYDDYARAIGQMTLDVQTWLKSHPDEYKKIPKIIEDSNYYPDTALIKYAQNWLQDVEQEEQKIHTFDDTSYWYDLRTDSCPIEADRMGHCGGDARATTLFSLRYKGKNQQKSGSYVTVAYNPDTDIIYQIKGKFNKAPDKKYYKHIAWLINALGNPRVLETGEHSDDLEGFAKMIQWLKENTDADIEDPANAWKEMEELVSATVNTYNDQYYYSKIFAEMVPEEEAQFGEPAYYFKGYVGVPIELEELSEEGQQKLKDGKYTRDDIKVITQLMDDPRATGKLTGGGAHPVKIDGDYAIFFFDAADLITQGISEDEWSLSTYDGDLRMFAEDVFNMDREASVSGNRLQQDLVRALITTGFMDGGPFLNLFMGARSGELQEDSDWIVETDVDGDDNPKLVWFQTPEIYFDLNRLERDGIDDELEYYKKPQVIGKILNSNAFKKTFMDQMSKEALTTETQMPDIQVWEVIFENYNPSQFVIEAAWQVDKDDSESKAVVASRWLSSEMGKSDFEDALHSTYGLVLEKAIGDEELGSQKSLDFPGGKRLPINESVSHKDIMKNWKNFKGF
jgi:hypothetical protein